MSPTEMKSYNVGMRVRLRARFRNTLTNGLEDPSSVTCRVRKPNGVAITPTVTQEEAAGVPTEGVYIADVSLDIGDGVWTYRFEGVGTVESANEGHFYVRSASV